MAVEAFLGDGSNTSIRGWIRAWRAGSYGGRRGSALAAGDGACGGPVAVREEKEGRGCARLKAVVRGWIWPWQQAAMAAGEGAPGRWRWSPWWPSRSPGEGKDART